MKWVLLVRTLNKEIDRDSRQWSIIKWGTSTIAGLSSLDTY